VPRHMKGRIAGPAPLCPDRSTPGAGSCKQNSASQNEKRNGENSPGGNLMQPSSWRQFHG